MTVNNVVICTFFSPEQKDSMGLDDVQLISLYRFVEHLPLSHAVCEPLKNVIQAGERFDI